MKIPIVMVALLLSACGLVESLDKALDDSVRLEAADDSAQIDTACAPPRCYPDLKPPSPN